MMMPHYVLVTPDGRRLGKARNGEPLHPVPTPFAYTYETHEQATAAARTYEGVASVSKVGR